MRTHQALVLNIYRLIDLVFLLPVLIVAHTLRYGEVGFGLSEQLIYFFSIGAWFISAKLAGYYQLTFRAISIFKKIKEVGKVSLIFLMALLVATSFVKDAPISRKLLIYYVILQAIMSYATHHLILKAIQARYQLSTKVRTLVYGAGDLGVQIAQEMLYHEELNRHFIGFIDDIVTHKENMLVMGNRESLLTICKEYQIEEVYVAMPPKKTQLIEDLLSFGEEEGVRIHIGLDFNKWYKLPLELNYLGQQPLLTVRKFPLDNPYDALLKRLVDITFSLIALIFLAPVMIGAAIAVRISSSGESDMVAQKVCFLLSARSNKMFINILKQVKV